MSQNTCTNCGLETAEDEHHVRVAFADSVHPGGCVRVRLDIYRTASGYISESLVLGTAARRGAMPAVSDGSITM